MLIKEKIIGKKIKVEVSEIAKKYKVIFETPAPEPIEQEISDFKGRTKIKGPKNLHYKNILSFRFDYQLMILILLLHLEFLKYLIRGF